MFNPRASTHYYYYYHFTDSTEHFKKSQSTRNANKNNRTVIVHVSFIEHWISVTEQSDPFTSPRVRPRRGNGHSQVSLRSCGQFDGRVGGEGESWGPASSLFRNQRRIHESRYRNLPHGSVQFNDRSEGVQLQEDIEVRLEMAGQ